MWYAFLTYTGKGCTAGLTLYKYNNDVVISFSSIGMNKYSGLIVHLILYYPFKLKLKFNEN